MKREVQVSKNQVLKRMKFPYFDFFLNVFSGVVILTTLSCEKEKEPAAPLGETMYVKVVQFHTGAPVPNAKVVVKGYWGGGFGTAPYEDRIDSFYTDSTGYCSFLRQKYVDLKETTYDAIGVCCNVPTSHYKESCTPISPETSPGVVVTLQPTGWLRFYVNDVVPLNPEFTHVSLSVKSFATYWPVFNFPDNYDPAIAYVMPLDGYKTSDWKVTFLTENDGITGNDTDSLFSMFVTGLDTIDVNIDY